MGWYGRVVFPWLCDLALNRDHVTKRRQELLSPVDGEILEIGFGTGLNLPCYPQQVRRLTIIDPNPGMHRKAARRIAQSDIEVDKRLLRGEELPFDAGRFDYVVSTFTLCSIADVSRALSEVHRVLRPGGTFLFLEHGLSSDKKVQKWQRRLNGLERLLLDNCHLDRDIRGLISAQPFASLEAKEFYLEQTPRTHGYLYQGTARK